MENIDIQKLKTGLEKEHGREFTMEEATQAKWDIEKFVNIFMEFADEEIRRKNKLIENPNGFLFDRQGRCSICHDYAEEGNLWFDKYGLKCMNCQKAINEKIIPASIAINEDSWYSKYELQKYFNIRGAYLSKCIKQSLLKNRIVQNENGKVHFQIFLIKDNKGVLPPKKYLKSRIVKVMRKGVECFTTEFWYEYIDLNLFTELLGKYKILWCLHETFAKEIDTSRFYWNKTNPIFGFKFSNGTNEEEPPPEEEFETVK